ncbi:MAG TPA: Ger(x)C family spore germination protein [Paenibacillus sp.]|jgi:Ger(x)C family germination protein
MISLRRLFGIFISLALLSGCWDSKEIQNIAYVTALGFDYVDGKYKAYAQVLNFSNIAKTEALEIGKIVPSWIGQGEGKTVTESMSSLYSTSQQRVLWGHVRTIIYSENLLKQTKIQNIYSAINRYREIRYNILMYGTKEPITKIFAQKSLLNFSPIESILSTPEQVYSQLSFIKPVYGYEVIADSNEGGGSCMLPSLAIDNKTWLEDEKKKSMLKMNGAYMLKNHKLAGWLSEEDLKGSRWLDRDLERTLTNVPDTEDPVATVVLINPHNAITPIIVDGKVHYDVKITVRAYLDELIESISEPNLEKETAKVLVSQIRNTFNKGLTIKSDVLNLENSLYRSNPHKWHELHHEKEDAFLLTKDSLHNVEVKVHFIHSGKYKSKI